MSGGSSQPTVTSSSSASEASPWAPAAPYLEQAMQNAAKSYAGGPTQYTPWSQVAGFTPQQQSAQSGIQNYITSPGTQQYLQNVGQASSGQLAGGTNYFNPFVGQTQANIAGYVGSNNLQDNADVLNQMAYGEQVNPYLDTQVQGSLQNLSNNFLVNTLPSLRRQAIGEGTYGSSRNALEEGKAAGELATQMQNAANQAYMGDYATQEQNRMNALSQIAQQQQQQFNVGSNVLGNYINTNLANVGQGLSAFPQAIGMPLQQLGQLYQVGADQQTQAQNELADATNRWNYEQNAGWENLAKYAQLINPLASYGQSTSKTTQTSYYPQQTSTAGNVMGGLLSMAPAIMGAFGGGAGAGASTAAGNSAGFSSMFGSGAGNTGWIPSGSMSSGNLLSLGG